METKLKLADTIKKMKNGMKLRTYKTLDESKGSMPETKAVEQDERTLATFETKDGELLSSAAEMDAQKGGQYEAAAKKAGVKKEDLIYTAPSMRAAQGGLEGGGLEKPEKMKLTKTEWKVPGLVPVVEEKDKMKKAEINPALTSQEPTHTAKGIKVKHLKAQGDGTHAVEIMEGPHKGKWTQVHEKDMTKLGSDLTKAKNLAPVGTKGVHNASSGSIKIGEKEGSIAGRSFAGDLARQGKVGPAIGWHKEKLTELQSMKKPNLTKTDNEDRLGMDCQECGAKEHEQYDSGKPYDEQPHCQECGTPVDAKGEPILKKKSLKKADVPAPEKTIDYRDMKAPADQSYHWKAKWKAKPIQEKREFIAKLAAQRKTMGMTKSKDDFVELSEKLGRDPTDAELAGHIGGKVDHAHEQGKAKQENKKLDKSLGEEPAPKKKFKNQDEEDAHTDAKARAKEEVKKYGVGGPPKDLKKTHDLAKKQGVPEGADLATHERCIQKVKAQGHDKSSAFAICNAAKAGMGKADDLKKDVVDIKTGKEIPQIDQNIRSYVQKLPEVSGRTTLSQKMHAMDKQLKAAKLKAAPTDLEKASWGWCSKCATMHPEGKHFAGGRNDPEAKKPIAKQGKPSGHKPMTDEDYKDLKRDEMEADEQLYGNGKD